jgi:hypothetical protein
VRLDFARPENRELWLAGYQYIKSLTMKGTYRTAFEWAKLLLSLDPEDDPYCIILMIHNLALRAHEFQYLLDLAETPAFKSRGAYASHIAPSLAFAAMQLKLGSKCRELLGKSIQDLPWLFCKLFQELNLDSPPPSIWGVEPRTDAEALFTEIYVRQTKDLWNTPEATSLLMEVAHAVDRLPDAEVCKVDNGEVTLSVARFVYLDNTPAVMALVPSKLLHRIPNSDSDPLPPDENQNIFSWPSQRRPFAVARGSQPGGALAGHFNPIEALRALIPGWTGDGGPADEAAIDEAGLREFLDTEGEGEDVDAALQQIQETGMPPQGPGFLNRVFGYLFNSRMQAAEHDADSDDGGGEDGLSDGTDTDVEERREQDPH